VSTQKSGIIAFDKLKIVNSS